MRHRRSRLLVLTAALLLPLATASAQVAGPAAYPGMGPGSSLLWAPPVHASAAPSIRIEQADKHDGTVLGLIVGAGLGLAAGWGFYNAICEAVDNHCSDSRLPYLLIGAGVGGGLGALIGSVAE
jgi:hypothetical protein